MEDSAPGRGPQQRICYCRSWPRRAQLIAFKATLYWIMLICRCRAQAPAGTTEGYAPEAPTIGINYGTLGDNLPAPSDAVAAMKAMKIGRVKLFSPNPDILTALANSGLEVVVAIPNEEIAAIAASAATADSWISGNVNAHYPATNIVTILVGNEILSNPSLQWGSLVPAIQNLHAALAARGADDNIKVSTAFAADVLAASFPPSAGTFRADVAATVILPLLNFLSATNSYFFVNLYPFLSYTTSNGDITLSYASFAETNAVQDGNLAYTSLLDAQLDAVVSAMERLGYYDVRVAVGESGWPTKADASWQPGASIENAANYNRRLVRKTLGAGFGTPKRPGVFVPTFIFALFNENQKPGPEMERNWGLLYPDTLKQVYPIDLTGQVGES